MKEDQWTQILGSYMSNQAQVSHALRDVYGLGPRRARQVCDQLGLGPTYRIGSLSADQLDQLMYLVRKQFTTGGSVRRRAVQAVQRLVRIGAYRGIRHVHGLPARGQRTCTNARTARRVRVFRAK